MKYLIIFLLSILSLMACNKPQNKTAVKSSSSSTELKEDVKPKTISLKEVSRIALVEANQFLTNAKLANLDLSTVMPIYDKAQAAYDNGEYKQAQKIAVEFRQLIEKLLSKK